MRAQPACAFPFSPPHIHLPATIILAAENKPILAAFTEKGWCGACMVMNAEGGIYGGFFGGTPSDKNVQPNLDRALASRQESTAKRKQAEKRSGAEKTPPPPSKPTCPSEQPNGTPTGNFGNKSERSTRKTPPDSPN